MEESTGTHISERPPSSPSTITGGALIREVMLPLTDGDDICGSGHLPSLLDLFWLYRDGQASCRLALGSANSLMLRWENGVWSLEVSGAPKTWPWSIIHHTFLMDKRSSRDPSISNEEARQILLSMRAYYEQAAPLVEQLRFGDFNAREPAAITPLDPASAD